MDPVSHVILGRTLVAALERPNQSRFGAGAGAAVILGALSPDVDSVFMPAGWDIYLRVHEIGTHSILGALIVGAAAAATVKLFVRTGRYRDLAAAAIIGALSHLGLDLLSGARLHLLWPLADTRFALPLVAMADPWLIALFALGSIALWLRRRFLARAATVLLCATTIFFAVKLVFFVRARQAADADARTANGMARAIEARWGSWTEWYVFERDNQTLDIWRVDGWHQTVSIELSWPVTRDTILIAASRSLDTVRNFLSVHDLAFAVEQPNDSETTVLWSDVRYCWQPTPGSGTISCGLWFGGRLARDGRALRQLVRLGEWTQTRPAPE
jgi:membrane-bound metal-dependent hydrolase YbcI (DUF457 family)